VNSHNSVYMLQIVLVLVTKVYMCMCSVGQELCDDARTRADAS
jgi:hypothetical protein